MEISQKHLRIISRALGFYSSDMSKVISELQREQAERADLPPSTILPLTEQKRDETNRLKELIDQLILRE